MDWHGYQDNSYLRQERQFQENDEALRNMSKVDGFDIESKVDIYLGSLCKTTLLRQEEHSQATWKLSYRDYLIALNKGCFKAYDLFFIQHDNKRLHRKYLNHDEYDSIVRKYGH